MFKKTVFRTTRKISSGICYEDHILFLIMIRNVFSSVRNFLVQIICLLGKIILYYLSVCSFCRVEILDSQTMGGAWSPSNLIPLLQMSLCDLPEVTEC